MVMHIEEVIIISKVYDSKFIIIKLCKLIIFNVIKINNQLKNSCFNNILHSKMIF